MTWKDIISKRALRPEQQNQVPDFIQQKRKDNVPPAPQLPDIPKPSQTPQQKEQYVQYQKFAKEKFNKKFNDVSVKLLEEIKSSVGGNFGKRGLDRLNQSGLENNLKSYLRELRETINTI